MLDDLKLKVCKANIQLTEYGLAPFTWGNASGIDRKQGLIVIKPSGVPYQKLSYDLMVVVDFDCNLVEGSLKPSSDTASHIELYKAFPLIGGVVHTHSKFATSFAQAGKEIPVLGTTHADFSKGPVPCTDSISFAEVEKQYEKNTGLAIVDHMRRKGISPYSVPAVLVKEHGPFVWGKDPECAVKNAAVLEIVAEMALHTMSINMLNSPQPIKEYLLEKHYMRKHGKNAYYGQEST